MPSLLTSTRYYFTSASLAGTSGIVMWVDEYIEEDSSYWEDVDYKYVEPSIATWQAYDLCSSLMYNSTLDKIVGTYSDCYAPSALVCSSAGAVNCDEVQDSDGGSHQAGGSGSVLESLINPVQTAELSKALLQKGKAYREVFKLMDLENAYPGLFEALWYSQIPCFDTEVKGANVVSRALLKKCFWKQVEIPCAAIFNTFPTDRGMCCTFNMAAADKIFKESQYRANVLYMQDRDREFATERSTKLPKSYTAKKEPIPQAGINKGLTLVLDAHTNLLSEGSVTEDFQGFVAVVAETNAYPLTEQRNIRLRPGFDNLVSLSATNIAAVSRIRQEDPKIRNCYFKDEVSLKMHIEYSQASCILECQIEFAQKNMSQSGEGVCAPWWGNYAYTYTLNRKRHGADAWYELHGTLDILFLFIGTYRLKTHRQRSCAILGRLKSSHVWCVRSRMTLASTVFQTARSPDTRPQSLLYPSGSATRRTWASVPCATPKAVWPYPPSSHPTSDTSTMRGRAKTFPFMWIDGSPTPEGTRETRRHCSPKLKTWLTMHILTWAMSMHCSPCHELSRVSTTMTFF